ncbi:hypothetical protein CCPUN_07170 [Cardinium endosymbiont of Culicoides punctatus]|nr:hypothetical protein CCPUN_07170 [Cardinium endosymbiont of Culicoides punctatus]
MYGLSDEQTIAQWIERPYWQYFCGYDYFEWKLPCNPSSLTRWRKRLGEEGLNKILSMTIQVAIKCKLVQPQELTKVVSDTTVMNKNIRFPTDSSLLNKAREKLVQLAKKTGIQLRQSYSRVGLFIKRKVDNYAHAKQYKRLAKGVKTLKTYLGRVVRDVERNLSNANQEIQLQFSDLLSLSKRIINQSKKSKNKVYSIHEPSVYCLSKGKSRQPYEFGCKVQITLTHKQGLILSTEALHPNVYDGHTLHKSLIQAEQLCGTKIQRVFVDKGYRGHKIPDGEYEIFISGQKRGMTPVLKKELKRRSSIEPHIGHMKADGKLEVNYLKGILGDKFNAVLCAIGHNLRMITRKMNQITT